MKARLNRGTKSKYERKKKYKRIIRVSITGLVCGVCTLYFATPIKAHKKDWSCAKGMVKLPISTVSMRGQYLMDDQMIKVEDILIQIPEEHKSYIGTNDEGSAYGYDAHVIAEKLKNYDYSNDGEKIVFLTFDDGVSTTVTPQILQTLREYDVKATFFLLGSNIEKGGKEAELLVRKLFADGNAIANHSYSHEYSHLYPHRSLNLDNFKSDFEKNETLIEEILGVDFTTRVLRCPGGYMSWGNMDELDSYLLEEDKVSIDWNALTKDAEGAKKDKDQLVQEAKLTSEGKDIVVLLMHDTYGKEATAEALPEIIEYFKESGYSFKTLV